MGQQAKLGLSAIAVRRIAQSTNGDLANELTNAVGGMDMMLEEFVFMFPMATRSQNRQEMDELAERFLAVTSEMDAYVNRMLEP